MLDRLKNALVSSFIGTITIGWLFTQAILHFAFIVSAPVASWLMRREYLGSPEHISADFSLYPALPEVAKSVSLFAVGYVLLRWLYYEAPQPQPRIASPSPKATA